MEISEGPNGSFFVFIELGACRKIESGTSGSPKVGLIVLFRLCASQSDKADVPAFVEFGKSYSTVVVSTDPGPFQFVKVGTTIFVEFGSVSGTPNNIGASQNVEVGVFVIIKRCPC